MSSTFTINRDQIIKLALRKLGVLEMGDNPDAETISNASFALNLFIKQCATQGLKLWKVEEMVVPLIDGYPVYLLGNGPNSDFMYNALDLAPNPIAVTDKPLKVIQGWYRNIQATPPVDTPLQLLSKQEYNLLGSKYSTGVSNSIFYDVKQNNGLLYVYLNPDAYSAANLEVHIVCQMPMNDLSRAQDIPDFPNEWMNTLVWNLADQLAIEYSVPANHRAEIATRAKVYRDELADWDVEPTSTFFQVDMRMSNAIIGNTI
jgi:hypothetical protein